MYRELIFKTGIYNKFSGKDQNNLATVLDLFTVAERKQVQQL